MRKVERSWKPRARLNFESSRYVRLSGLTLAECFIGRLRAAIYRATAIHRVVRVLARGYCAYVWHIAC